MTQRDEGHDYRDSKNKAQAYERKKKEKEKLDNFKLNYCIAHADYLHSKLIKMIVDDFKNQKNNFGEKDFLTKKSLSELRKYVEDQILADGFLVADEE